MDENMSGPCRDKHWSELTDSEKLERLRKVIKQREWVIESLQKQVEDLLRHSHDVLGCVTVRIDNPVLSGYRNRALTERQGDDTYF